MSSKHHPGHHPGHHHPGHKPHHSPPYVRRNAWYGPHALSRGTRRPAYYPVVPFTYVNPNYVVNPRLRSEPLRLHLFPVPDGREVQLVSVSRQLLSILRGKRSTRLLLIKFCSEFFFFYPRVVNHKRKKTNIRKIQKLERKYPGYLR